MQSQAEAGHATITWNAFKSGLLVVSVCHFQSCHLLIF